MTVPAWKAMLQGRYDTYIIATNRESSEQIEAQSHYFTSISQSSLGGIAIARRCTKQHGPYGDGGSVVQPFAPIP